MWHHLLLVTKYRRKVIDEQISNKLREMFAHIGKTYNITLQEWNHEADHVHVLFKSHPNSELSKFINAYKSASSKISKKSSLISKQIVKRIFLVKKFLFVDSRRCANKCYKKAHRKAGRR